MTRDTKMAAMLVAVLVLLAILLVGCMSIDNSTTYRLDRAVVSGNVDLDTLNDIDTAKDAAVTDPDGGTVMTGEGSDAITPDLGGLVSGATGAAGSAIGGLGGLGGLLGGDDGAPEPQLDEPTLEDILGDD